MRRKPSVRRAASYALAPIALLVLGAASCALCSPDFCLGPCELFDGMTGLRAHLNPPSMGECGGCAGDCGEGTTDWLLVSLTLDASPAPVYRVYLRALGESIETGGFIPPVGAGVVIDSGELPQNLWLEFNVQYGVYIGAIFPYGPLTVGETTVTLFAAYPAGQLENIGDRWQLGLELGYGMGTVFFEGYLAPCPAASVPVSVSPTWGAVKALFGS